MKRRTREQADICYLMTAPLMPGYTKIGCCNSVDNLLTRLHNLEQGCPGGLKIAHYWQGKQGEGYALEQALLAYFEVARLDGESEWVMADAIDVVMARSLLP